MKKQSYSNSIIRIDKLGVGEIPDAQFIYFTLSMSLIKSTIAAPNKTIV